MGTFLAGLAVAAAAALASVVGASAYSGMLATAATCLTITWVATGILAGAAQMAAAVFQCGAALTALLAERAPGTRSAAAPATRTRTASARARAAPSRVRPPMATRTRRPGRATRPRSAASTTPTAATGKRKGRAATRPPVVRRTARTPATTATARSAVRTGHLDDEPGHVVPGEVPLEPALLLAPHLAGVCERDPLRAGDLVFDRLVRLLDQQHGGVEQIRHGAEAIWPARPARRGNVLVCDVLGRAVQI